MDKCCQWWFSERERHRWARRRLNSLKSNMSSHGTEGHCQGFNSLSTCAPFTFCIFISLRSVRAPDTTHSSRSVRPLEARRVDYLFDRRFKCVSLASSSGLIEWARPSQGTDMAFQNSILSAVRDRTAWLTSCLSIEKKKRKSASPVCRCILVPPP